MRPFGDSPLERGGYLPHPTLSMPRGRTPACSVCSSDFRAGRADGPSPVERRGGHLCARVAEVIKRLWGAEMNYLSEVMGSQTEKKGSVVQP